MIKAAQPTFGAIVEEGDVGTPLILVCEHASNTIPAAWGDLGLSAEARVAHIAWDPGALDLARGMARALGACLVHAPVSRLVYDLNRSPDHPGAMPVRSEVFDIPGNAGLQAPARLARTRAVYQAFHDDLHGVVAGRLAVGVVPVMVTVHSFTPVWHGTQRQVEFGVIHDADPDLALGIVAAAAGSGLRVALNQPYAAADGVTHTLRLHAGPYGLRNAMLEVRNDLIATPDAAATMALRIAPMIARAMALTPAQVA